VFFPRRARNGRRTRVFVKAARVILPSGAIIGSGEIISDAGSDGTIRIPRRFYFPTRRTVPGTGVPHLWPPTFVGSKLSHRLLNSRFTIFELGANILSPRKRTEAKRTCTAGV